MKTVFFFSLSILKFLIWKTCFGKEVVSYKIVGGTKAATHEFPFQASLQKRSSFGYIHTCGASLIHPEWLVTAAHCISVNSTSPFKIMLGSSSLKEVSEENYYSVIKIVIKYGFNVQDFNNDIALIQISPAAEDIDTFIQLPQGPPDRNASAVAVGWGATSDGGPASYDLLTAELNIIVREDCLQYYSFLTESMICAGYEEGGVDTCQGDSGGPLLQWRGTAAVMVGIVSWGVGCAEEGHPGVYTDMALFTDWVKSYVFASQ